MCHQRRTECHMCKMSHIEHHSQAWLYPSHVIGSKLSYLIAQLRLIHIHLTDNMRQLACIDFHWTGGRAQTISGTCLITIVFILSAQYLRPLRISSRNLKVTYLSLYCNTHSARHCQSTRHTVDLTESALDTLICTFHLFYCLLGGRELRIHEILSAIGNTCEVIVEHRQRFQALYETVWVIVEDYPLIQQSVRIKDWFQFLHCLIGLVTPFVLYKRCHIPSRTMLCLQWTVVSFNHKLCHITHHLCITCHLMLVCKALVQDKVIVTLKCMSIDTSIGITVFSNHLLQFHRSLRQRIYWECHILDKTRSADWSCSSHTWENTTSYSPILAIYYRILCKLRRNIQTELS